MQTQLFNENNIINNDVIGFNQNINKEKTKMKTFNSKEELNNLFKLFEEVATKITPTEVIQFYQKIEDKLTEIYECGFNDGSKINNELNKLINHKKK